MPFEFFGVVELSFAFAGDAGFAAAVAPLEYFRAGFDAPTPHFLSFAFGVEALDALIAGVDDVHVVR